MKTTTTTFQAVLMGLCLASCVLAQGFPSYHRQVSVERNFAAKIKSLIEFPFEVPSVPETAFWRSLHKCNK